MIPYKENKTYYMDFYNNINQNKKYIKNEREKYFVLHEIKQRNKMNYFYFDNILMHYLHKDIDDPFNYFYHDCFMNKNICSIKQIKTWYPNIEVYHNDEQNLIVDYDKKRYEICNFIEKFIYEKDIDFYLEKIKVIDEKNISNNIDLLIVLHIGDNNIGINILRDIIMNMNEDILLCINITNLEKSDDLILFIKKNVKRYFLTLTPDLGNDITPSILSYLKLMKLYNINYNYVLKLHTKSDGIWRNKMINLFTNGNIDVFKRLFYCKNIGVIGNYVYLRKKDAFCQKVFDEFYNDYFNEECDFIGGTVFMCSKEVFENASRIINKILLNAVNMTFYYDNYLFFENSVIHAIERLFGYSSHLISRVNVGVDFYKKQEKDVFLMLHDNMHYNNTIIEKLKNISDNICCLYDDEKIISDNIVGCEFKKIKNIYQITNVIKIINNKREDGFTVCIINNFKNKFDLVDIIGSIDIIYNYNLIIFMCENKRCAIAINNKNIKNIKNIFLNKKTNDFNVYMCNEKNKIIINV